MIDFHCHLDLYPDALALLPQVAERNMFTLVVTTSPRAWQATSHVFAGYENIKVALGMHPEIVREKSDERALLLSCVSKTDYIGEIGIDGSPGHQGDLSIQQAIFGDVLIECERSGGKILSIHSRRAAGCVLDYIERHCRKSVPVLHWFSGTIQEARRAVDLGCWFSVGPAMLRSSKGRVILGELPMDKVLPESDGPFAQNISGPLMPWEAINISDIVAPIWMMSRGGVSIKMKQNLSVIQGILKELLGHQG